MAAGTYQYDVLSPGKWFRLLLIEPGQQEDDLHCALVTTALEKNTYYKALSYVWGDPANIGRVICSGFERTVTASLLGGLRQLRHPEKTEVVWADAICINQADMGEKAVQVDMMGTIYDLAAEVLVWLGDDTNFLASQAFECLPAVNQAIVTGAQRTVSESGMFLKLDQSQGTAPNPVMVSRNEMTLLLTDHQLEAIKQLYQLPWFTRVWVLQEVGLATKATAYWGDCRVDFSEIALFVWFATNDRDLQERIGPKIRAVISGCPYNAVYGVWSTYNKKSSWIHASAPLKIWAEHLAAETRIDFLLILEASRMFNATDARDHVFAFLGHPCAVQPGTKEPLVKADYGNGLDHLYRRVTESLAKTSLNFLVHAQNTAEILARDNHPSWIPRWDSNIENAPAAFWEAWDASLRIKNEYAHLNQISENRLYVSALVFDKVAHQTKVMESSDFDHGDYNSHANIGSLIEECWGLTERAAETVPHKYPGNHVLALASVLGCSYNSPSSSEQHDIGDFCQACVYFNSKFFNEKLLPLRLTYEWEVMQHRKFAGRFHHAGKNRRFFVTGGGYWGLGPAIMQEGDLCAVLLGGDVPFILRPTPKKGTLRLVGQAYIYGIMYGEMMGDSDRGIMINEEKICIV